ncbi:thioredoxin [Candidimonas sp. SYP-B2681]|uniref:thioredoxin family protein n=1 Tax=Candidimonas sp. SYP-B2681 TaxID=2497686 RepID=UPI000F883DBB|nr:thioredoxin family protein [Candidimonas sp. SYP-B2681]RTZ42315.1 thioredoxin [Candidimonas sp. SYP-B2681]
MPVYDSQHDAPALRSRLKESTGLVIACYCAAWCDTCTQYRPDFDSLADQWPQHTFVWIDIEESPDLLGEEDVENFPTVVIQGPKGNLFYGTLLPYISHLARLISHMDDRTPVIKGGPALLQILLAPAAQ